jgi:hypothetical protein
MRKSYWMGEGVREGGGKEGEYHVAHRVTLKAKFLGEVEKDVFYFLGGHGNLSVCRTRQGIKGTDGRISKG